MIRAYCDASKRNGKIAIAGIVLAGNIFVDYELRILDDITSTSQAELRAVMLIFELIGRNYDTPQDVCIHSDNASILQQYNTSLTTGSIPGNRVYREDWVKLLEMSKHCNVVTRRIRSHTGVRSCHSLCDYAVRSILSTESLKRIYSEAN